MEVAKYRNRKMSIRQNIESAGHRIAEYRTRKISKDKYRKDKRSENQNIKYKKSKWQNIEGNILK